MTDKIPKSENALLNLYFPPTRFYMLSLRHNMPLTRRLEVLLGDAVSAGPGSGAVTVAFLRRSVAVEEGDVVAVLVETCSR